MTYQALARKWRPKTFAELVGQEHVVTALSNALQRGRLHHAYLLTGTRGVGKTTIARILAKSLNCATGVTATPCGACDACRDIDAGRFVDLLELDAASNTGVDNMREILDNARYAPTVGRYKVYLIDEVHMLSKGAFNSMLKTLEEPPEHVKFVLATTDPQKIPVTVLSRCLQFNLKPLPASDIAARIDAILEQEGVPREAGGVALVARAARGSLRDGLSLLDQAIAYGGGEVREPVVRAMLGAIDREAVYRIVEALAAGDGKALLAEADALSARGLAPSSALDELAALFHRIAVAQVVPDAARSFEDAEQVAAFAARFDAEAVQLAYQIVTQGRADLAIAPDEAVGLSMTLLRLLAFEPGPGRAVPAGGGTAAAPARPREPVAPTLGSVRDARPRPDPAREAAPAVPAPSSPAPADARPLPDAPSDWPAYVATLRLGGMAAQLAAQTELRSVEGHVVNLRLPATYKHLADRAYSDKLKAALEQASGRKLMLAFEVGEAAPASLAAKEKRERDEARERTEAAFRAEPFVQELVERFDGRVRPDSIKPL
ncbi:MAG TPA: DNA polymerase III subunit gamma/tau [Casimicrobiaceae bacterium]|nr:DNA polymerase III subunit gamma/tau [Casimicrobiaceae bacterium]